MNVLDADDFTHYQLTGGLECPHCSSRNLKWLEEIITIADCTAFQKVECADCHNIWTDHYALTHVELEI